MRLYRWILPGALAVLVAAGLAEDKPKNDAQRDQFLGQVKSVNGARISEAPAEQQKRIPFSVPLICHICEYDRDGNRVTNGQMVDGKFVGNTTVVQRNPNGYAERTATMGTVDDPAVGSIHEVVGPFGTIDFQAFSKGKLTIHETTIYDAKGHVAESQTVDGTGTTVQHVFYKWGDGPDWLEQSLYVKNDVLLLRETYDPDTDESDYTCFDPAGAPLVTWKEARGKVLSFWAATDDPRQCGESFIADAGNGNHVVYQCQKSTGCIGRYSRSEYYGPEKHNIKHTDFRDAAGALLWSADYEYEFDSQQNWTHRKIWVTFPGESNRTLFSEDAQTITYWDE